MTPTQISSLTYVEAKNVRYVKAYARLSGRLLWTLACSTAAAIGMLIVVMNPVFLVIWLMNRDRQYRDDDERR
jgi:hypothetical protein